MDNTIASFLVALGFEVNKGSLDTAKKSISDYEKAVREAEKRIEDARWEGAKSAEEIAKLAREANLKEARAALAMAQEREKAEKEQSKKREERNKEFVSGMGKLALAAAAAATAISYAVNRVTQAFDNLGFVSARTGASVQSLNSLGYAFKQVGGSSQQAVGAVEKFSQALRQNDGLKSYIKGLGVDTTKDMADQLLDTVDALSKHEYQVGSREAGMLGISEEDYKLLTQYAAKVKEYRAEYDATTKSLGVNSKEAADASMAFQRSLNRLMATASALGDKLMVGLAPALQRIVDRFQDWIRSNPEKVERIMDNISKALVWVVEKIGALLESITGGNGDEFLKRWDAFSMGVERFASALERLIKIGVGATDSPLFKVLKLLTVDNPLATWPSRLLVGSAEASTGGGGSAGGSIPGAVSDDRSWWQRHAPRALGGRDAPSPQGGIPLGSTAGNLTALYEAEAKRAGINPRIMHGIRAGESLHSNAYDVKSDSREDSYGPFQLNRRGGLGAEFEKETGLDLHDPKTIPAQVRWAAEHIKKRLASNPNYNPGSEWYGYKGNRDADRSWGNSGYVPTPEGAGNNRVASDAPAPAGTPRMTSGLATIRSKSGRTFQVAAEFAANFQGFIDDYEKAGGVIGPNSGGNNERPNNRSYHPIGRAIDVNQVGRGVRAGGQTLPLGVEDSLAEKWGLRSGNSFSSNDNGHFEVHQAEAARAAIERMKAQAQSDRAATRALTAAPRMDPGGFDVNAVMQPAPNPAHTVNNNRTGGTVHQTFNQTTTIHGADRPKEAARIMEAAFGNMHGLALQNAQSATV